MCHTFLLRLSLLCFVRKETSEVQETKPEEGEKPAEEKQVEEAGEQPQSQEAQPEQVTFKCCTIVLLVFSLVHDY